MAESNNNVQAVLGMGTMAEKEESVAAETLRTFQWEITQTAQKNAQSKVRNSSSQPKRKNFELKDSIKTVFFFYSFQML